MHPEHANFYPIRGSPGYKGQADEALVSLKLEEDLVVNRKGTSSIWIYFAFRRDDVLQTQVLCKTCRAVAATS